MVLALKEWLPVISEIGKGNTSLLFRRGGVLDKAGFKLVRSCDRHLFFPTTFHVKLDGTEGQFLKNPEPYRDLLNLDIKHDWDSIRCELAFEVTGAWNTSDARIGDVLDAWHCYGPQFVEKRLSGTRKGPLTVMEVRAYRLDEPVVLENTDDLYGCFSWLDLGLDAGQIEAGVACVEDEIFLHHQETLREALRGTEVEDVLS